MLGLLILGGPRLARKFLRSFFIGIDLYVILSVNGKDVAYKNPEGVLGREAAGDFSLRTFIFGSV